MAGHTINVSVLADTKQFSSAMKEVSRATGLDKIGSAAKTAGKFVAGAAAAVGGLAVGIGGLALKGGFERALNIEDAQAKLKGLGYDTKAIDQIMVNALASVKGTAYGLGDAATLAGQAVAAGIKPGEDLERQLTLVGDAAALAGTDMGEMGSIFTKVWTSGKVSTDELNQIADRGIPIWKRLGEEYGVTQEELRKMVSEGKVDAETFASVMEDTVGGSALAMGDTTRGAWKNMMAALSRSGEAFLKGVFPSFKTGIDGITGLLDKVTPYAKIAGEAVGKWVTETAIPAIENLLPKIEAWLSKTRDDLVPVLEDLRAKWQDEIKPALEQVGDYITTTVIPAFETLTTWIKDHKDEILIAVGAITTFVATFAAIQQVIAWVNAVKAAFVLLNAALAASPFTLIAAAIAAVVAGLYLFFTQTETGREIWAVAWAAIQAAAQAVAEWFVTVAWPMIQAAWEGIKAAAQAVADWMVNTAWPAIQAAWDGIKAAAQAAADWFMTYVWPVIDAAIELVIAVVERLKANWETVWAAIQAVWAVIGPPLMAAITVAITVLKGVWEVVWGAIKTYLETVWKVMKTAVETALRVIESVIRAVTAAIKGDWSGAWENIKQALSRAWEGMKSIARTATEGLKTIVTDAMTRVKSGMDTAWTNIKTALSQAWEDMKTKTSTKIGEIVEYVRGIPGKITSALGDLSGLLTSAASQVIDGFVGGLRSGFDRVKTELGNLTSLLPDWKGPRERDRNILRDSGHLVIEGFVEGLEDRYSAVKRSLRGLTRDVANTPFEAPSVPGQDPVYRDARFARSATATASAATSATTEVHVHLEVEDLAAIRTVEDFISMIDVRRRMAVGAT